jgi:hypothetical protein
MSRGYTKGLHRGKCPNAYSCQEEEKKNADGTDKSDVWWLRKKVPQRYRALVGSGEIWRSLGTTDRKAASLLCVKLSAEFDRDWEHRLQAAKAVGRTTARAAPDNHGTQRTAAPRPRANPRRPDR